MRRHAITGLVALLLAIGAAAGSSAQDRGADRPADHPKQGQRQDRDKKSGGDRQPGRDRRDSRDGKSSGDRQGAGNRNRTGSAERSKDRPDGGRPRNGARTGSDGGTRRPGAGDRPSGGDRPRSGEHGFQKSGSSRPRTGTRTRTHVQLPSTPDRVRQWQQDQRGAWQRHRAGRFDSEHRSWTQRGGYHGYRIGPRRYGRHFGRDHFFHLYPLPFMVVGGFPRFQYAGYWFIVVEPYPEYWGPDWYRTDEVYIEFVGDGYYLFNRRFPSRPGVAIRIAF